MIIIYRCVYAYMTRIETRGVRLSELFNFLSFSSRFIYFFTRWVPRRRRCHLRIHVHYYIIIIIYMLELCRFNIIILNIYYIHRPVVIVVVLVVVLIILLCVPRLSRPVSHSLPLSLSLPIQTGLVSSPPFIRDERSRCLHLRVTRTRIEQPPPYLNIIILLWTRRVCAG